MTSEQTPSRRVDTMKVGGGADYAKVATRLHEFHGDNAECSIETTVDFKDGWILATARVTSKRGVYTGHSLGQAKGLKALEKIETIAVGRALAFAGYSSKGEIASFEEMQDYDRDTRGRRDDPVISLLARKIDEATKPSELSVVRQKIQALVADEAISFSDGNELMRKLDSKLFVVSATYSIDEDD